MNKRTVEGVLRRPNHKACTKIQAASQDLKLLLSPHTGSSHSKSKSKCPLTKSRPVAVILVLVCLFAVWFVRSLIVERGFGYEFGQCMFKSVGSLNQYAKSTSHYQSVSDVLGSAPRLGFLSADFPTDKDFTHNYTNNYNTLLEPYQKHANSVLEVGVKKGGSIQLWREYFEPTTFIYGIDIDPGVPTFVSDAHIKILIMDSRDREKVNTAFRGLPPFDVIVDDGRHTRGSIMMTYNALRPKLHEQGVYIIEDWDVRNTRFEPTIASDTVVQLADASGYESLLVVCPEQSRASCKSLGGTVVVAGK